MSKEKDIVINVGRQIGAGGREIGRMLAAEFGATLFDRELLQRAARESGMSERLFEQHDEHKSFVRSFLHMPGAMSGLGYGQAGGLTQDSLFKFQSDAILRAADEGPCVFVGRCADYVLRNRDNVVNVFVTAHIDVRTARVMERRGMGRGEARRFIEQGESKRASYYNYYTGKRWGHAGSYDLCIDSGLLGLEQTARFISQFVRKKTEAQAG